LAAADYFCLRQYIEGPRWRELSLDVHSFSVLTRSSIAGLAFSVAFQDNTQAHSLVKQCTGSSANTWTLLQLPNLPIWSGTFSAAPGQAGYFLFIVLAAGTTYTAAASSAWQTGNIFGVTGMSNFLATAGATFDIAIVQHEPGALCTTPIDCPFTQNYDDCLRYFEKSYPYAVAPGTVSTAGAINFWTGSAQNPFIPVRFKKVMAKTPTVVGYSDVSGAINNVRDVGAAVDRAISSTLKPGDTAFAGFVTTTQGASIWQASFHYTADTGW
jgi:hypothetical protein